MANKKVLQYSSLVHGEESSPDCVAIQRTVLP